MTIREAIQRVQKDKRFEDKARYVISSKLVFNKLCSIRSKFLSYKLRKNQLVNQWNYDVLPCAEMIKVDKSECNIITTENYVYRTKHKLPKPLNDLNVHFIQSIFSLDGSFKYDLISTANKNYIDGNKYSKDRAFAYIFNGYLYVNKRIDILTITGLFQNPEEVYAFPIKCNNNEETNCISLLDNDFKIEADLENDVIESTIIELLKPQQVNNEQKSE